MKKTISIFILLGVFCMSSCTFQKSDKNQVGAGLNHSDIVGKWSQVNKNEKTPHIEAIQLRNDSTVEIQIADSRGKKNIEGKWKVGSEKVVGSVSFISVSVQYDIKISFYLDHTIHLLLMKLQKENNKMVMTSPDYRFEKKTN
ncbi:MAG: hypothetical protein AB2L20_03395 [Mangrovibacterium sp.]